MDRSNVMDGGMRGFSRRSFNGWRKLDVKFVDEDGIDTGGPMREFMRLSLKEIKALPIFGGHDDSKLLILDYNGLK